ncbi:MAG TPA: hypothetical protein VHC22_24640 [Pirellulales bacterium]|nr:hypothetical protein [Pirellulales bacterium]
MMRAISTVWVRLHRLALPVALACLSVLVPARADDAWKFVLPETGTEHAYPPLRAIPLASDKPDDVQEMVTYRGASRRYAQLRYGSPSAPRVLVVVDQVSSTDVDLYVDTDRNRTIDANERCAGEGRLWRVPLDVQYAQGETFDVYPREFVFRLGSTGRTLSYAAAGYLAGRVTLAETGEPLVSVRRMDGDANGFFTDPQDRLWIDLNDDGRWDPVDEQFLYSTILTIAGDRYVLRSDERANQLALAKLEGTGTLQLAVRQKSGTATGGPGTLGHVSEIAVTLVGRDGSAVGLRGTTQVSAPIGDYRVSAVAVTLDDLAGGPRWNFVFSDGQPSDAKRWYSLERDATVTIDPLEKVDFLAGAWKTDGKCRPGDDLTFQPKLLTSDGLLINTCYRGTHDTGRDGSNATIKLAASDGTLLSSAQSGFA